VWIVAHGTNVIFDVIIPRTATADVVYIPRTCGGLTDSNKSQQHTHGDHKRSEQYSATFEFDLQRPLCDLGGSRDLQDACCSTSRKLRNCYRAARKSHIDLISARAISPFPSPSISHSQSPFTSCLMSVDGTIAVDCDCALLALSYCNALG